MILDYNLKREQHYLNVKASTMILANSMIILLALAIGVGIWGIFTFNHKILYIFMVILLTFLMSLYILFTIVLYGNFKVFNQRIDYDNVMKKSSEIILDFLESRTTKNYKLLGIYETEDIIIIEFVPYLLKKDSDKYKPAIALMDKEVLEGSTWQNIVESNDAMRRLKELKEFAQKNEASKLRYLGNQVYYFSHVAESV